MGNNMTSNSLTFETYNNSCVYRLPCGVCERTNKRCPLFYDGPSWNIDNNHFTVTTNKDTITLNNKTFECKEKEHD